MVLRSVSLTNTFLTYISAWIATYRLSVFPLLWLATVSTASFIVTLNVSIIFGPMTGKLTLNNFNELLPKINPIFIIGINNFELVPIFIGIKVQPLTVTTIVMLIDLIIAILSLSLAINRFKKANLEIIS
jgi:hypothetical protein